MIKNTNADGSKDFHADTHPELEGEGIPPFDNLGYEEAPVPPKEPTFSPNAVRNFVFMGTVAWALLLGGALWISKIKGVPWW